MAKAQRVVTITAENGLHTRPAAVFTGLAKTFASRIAVSVDGQSADAKSLFKLQLLPVSRGAAMTISAEGEDAEQAVTALADCLASLGKAGS